MVVNADCINRRTENCIVNLKGIFMNKIYSEYLGNYILLCGSTSTIESFFVSEH